MNNNEPIHWGGVECDWHGEVFTVRIPHRCADWPARWLDEHLTKLLRKVPELENAQAAVSEVRPAQGDGVDWGYIHITGLKSPWPDAHVLREHVAGAVREAYATADLAVGEAERFSEALRRVPTTI